jgi:hypothetical protein
MPFHRWVRLPASARCGRVPNLAVIVRQHVPQTAEGYGRHLHAKQADVRSGKSDEILPPGPTGGVSSAKNDRKPRHTAGGASRRRLVRPTPPCSRMPRAPATRLLRIRSGVRFKSRNRAGAPITSTRSKETTRLLRFVHHTSPLSGCRQSS